MTEKELNKKLEKEIKILKLQVKMKENIYNIIQNECKTNAMNYKTNWIF